MPTDRTAAASLAAASIAAASLAAALAAAGTVAAASAANAAPVRSILVLSVRVSGQPAQTVTLRCEPPRGSHPSAAEACAAVAEANGRLTALKPQEGVMCTMQYQPATAVAKGTWRGRSVQYKKAFSNVCVLRAETGPVFRF
jgi:hypothetical protein